MEADHSITAPEQLVGRIWKCPFCHKGIEVTTDGVTHWGKKHFAMYSLEDLFELNQMLIHFEKLEHKFWFGE